MANELTIIQTLNRFEEDIKTLVGNNLTAFRELYPTLEGGGVSGDNLYAAKDHNHDTLYSAKNHTHSEYAASGHNHDSAYAAKSTTYTKTEVDNKVKTSTFVNYGLNGCNIDTTTGNWSVGISDSSHGTLPTYFDGSAVSYINVTQHEGETFRTQIAVKCNAGEDTSRNCGQMWMRDSHAGGVWSKWTQFIAAEYDSTTNTLNFIM